MFGKKEIVQSGELIEGSIKADANYIEAYYKLSGNTEKVRNFFTDLIEKPVETITNDIYAALGIN